MAESPVRKRAVAASRVAQTNQRRPAVRVRPAAPMLGDDEAPVDNYALRLTEALEAISSKQGTAPGHAAPKRAQAYPQDESSPQQPRASLGGWLKALDKLPPIRLPVGPAIPWRLGLPALVVVAIVMFLMSRAPAATDNGGVHLPAAATDSGGVHLPAASTDTGGVHLPTQETYAAQSSPLFTNAQTPVPVADGPSPVAQAAPQPAQPSIGVPEPALGFDVMDIAIKLIAVLALAYASMLLLKRFGAGGAGAARMGGASAELRVISSLVLAPNRSVHVLRVPGGKTLLVGSTPSQVNLIADLGDQAPEEESSDGTSFFDVLKSKIT